MTLISLLMSALSPDGFGREVTLFKVRGETIGKEDVVYLGCVAGILELLTFLLVDILFEAAVTREESL